MRTVRLSPRRHLIRRVIALCLLCAGTIFLIDALGALDHAEDWTVDLRFDVRGRRPQHGAVVVVGIDDSSLNQLVSSHGNWPWPRSVHAELVGLLAAAGARVIAFDLFFMQPDQHPVEGHLGHDDRLVQGVRRSSSVLLATYYEPPPKIRERPASPGEGQLAATPAILDPSLLDSVDALNARSSRTPTTLPHWLIPPTKQYFWRLPLPDLARAARGCGFVDIDPDWDGVYRRVQPVQAVDSQRLYVHLGVAVAAAALGVPLKEITLDSTEVVRLGDRRILPVDADGKLLIDFAGGATQWVEEGLRERMPSAFPYFSYGDVLSGRVPPSVFRDKVVFVGVVARSLGDVKANPFDAAGTGLDLNAHLADAILAGRLPRFLPLYGLPLLMLLLTFLLCSALCARTLARATGGTLAIGVPYLTGAYLLFTYGGLVVPVATPMLTVAACYTGVMALRFATEQREQRRVRRFFERYVTREIAAEVLEDPEAAQMGGRRREVTMLFSDIRGFTTMSEQLPAETVIQLLNEYFAEMVPIIERYRGTTNSFIGDAIFAFWGAPLPQEDQAERAVLTGLEMLEAMPALHARWREQGLPAFEIGIGIHLGTAVIGNIGTEERSHYTTIGDDVNTAARLESLNSQEGTKFLISDAVYARVAHLIEARRLPPLAVKNKAQPLNVYEVLGRSKTSDE
jgi:adenylate cyclase